MLPPEDLRRRVKAARALAGYGSTKELADAIGGSAKLGDRTLRTLEGDKAPRPFRAGELDVIAKACGVAPAFFRIDFQTLQEPSVAGAPTLEERIAALEERLNQEVDPALAALDATRSPADVDLDVADSPGRSVRDRNPRSQDG